MLSMQQAVRTSDAATGRKAQRSHHSSFPMQTLRTPSPASSSLSSSPTPSVIDEEIVVDVSNIPTLSSPSSLFPSATVRPSTSTSTSTSASASALGMSDGSSDAEEDEDDEEDDDVDGRGKEKTALLRHSFTPPLRSLHAPTSSSSPQASAVFRIADVKPTPLHQLRHVEQLTSLSHPLPLSRPHSPSSHRQTYDPHSPSSPDSTRSVSDSLLRRSLSSLSSSRASALQLTDKSRVPLWQILALSSYWFGWSFLWLPLLIVIIPTQAQQIAGDDNKVTQDRDTTRQTDSRQTIASDIHSCQSFIALCG
jgi:hypothetical protein